MFSGCVEDFYSQTAVTGNFQSPSYPDPYPAYMTCRYYFYGNESLNERVQITFLDFNLYYDRGDANDTDIRYSSLVHTGTRCRQSVSLLWLVCLCLVVATLTLSVFTTSPMTPVHMNWACTVGHVLPPPLWVKTPPLNSASIAELFLLQKTSADFKHTINSFPVCCVSFYTHSFTGWFLLPVLFIANMYLCYR